MDRLVDRTEFDILLTPIHNKPICDDGNLSNAACIYNTWDPGIKSPPRRRQQDWTNSYVMYTTTASAQISPTTNTPLSPTATSMYLSPSNGSSTLVTSVLLIESQAPQSLWQSSAHHWQVLPLSLMVLAGIMGNVLVCMAVATEKKLQNVTNYFLTSLAVADLFVCCVVMPLSIMTEFMGVWPLGLAMCTLWQVTDVMMCTSSIMHMCVISLDRYITMRNPLSSRHKSRASVALKMAAVWIISLATASPIIVLSLLQPQDILNPDFQCGIFNQYFLVTGSLIAFFIPLAIMVVAYSLTISLLNKQAKRCLRRGSDGMRRTRSRKKFFNKMPTPAAPSLKLETQSMNGFKPFSRGIRKPSYANVTASELEPLHVSDNKRGGGSGKRKGSTVSNATTCTNLSRKTSLANNNNRNSLESNETPPPPQYLHPNMVSGSRGGSIRINHSENKALILENAKTSQTGSGNEKFTFAAVKKVECNNTLSKDQSNSRVIDENGYISLVQQHAKNTNKHVNSTNHKPSNKEQQHRTGPTNQTVNAITHNHTAPDLLPRHGVFAILPAVNNKKNDTKGESPAKSELHVDDALENSLSGQNTTNVLRHSKGPLGCRNGLIQLKDIGGGSLLQAERKKCQIDSSESSVQDTVQINRQKTVPSPKRGGSSPLSVTFRLENVPDKSNTTKTAICDSIHSHNTKHSLEVVVPGEPNQNGHHGKRIGDDDDTNNETVPRPRSDVWARIAARQKQAAADSRTNGSNNAAAESGTNESTGHDAPKPKSNVWAKIAARHMQAAAENSTNQKGTAAAENGTNDPSCNDPLDQKTPSFRDLVQKHQAAIKVAGILMAKREQKNTVKTEQKAIKVLGTMFAIFVICWAPFFTINFAMGLCSCDIKIIVFKVFLWLGYFGSTLNPIIYTIFNKSFRDFFVKRLTCGKYAIENGKTLRSMSLTRTSTSKSKSTRSRRPRNSTVLKLQGIPQPSRSSSPDKYIAIENTNM